MGRCPAADRGGSREAGCRAQFAGGKRPAPTEPAGETSAPRSRGCKGSWCPVGTVQDRPRRQPRPQPLPSPTPKKGGQTSPSWGATEPGVFACGRGGQGATETASAATAFGVCAACAALLSPAAPVKAVELCSTPRKLLKKFDQNFSLSLPHPSATPYTMRNKGWLNSTTWPLPTQISATVPSTSAGISFISFMASIMHRVSPFFTWSPTSTKGRASGPGAE